VDKQSYFGRERRKKKKKERRGNKESGWDLPPKREEVGSEESGIINPLRLATIQTLNSESIQR